MHFCRKTNSELGPKWDQSINLVPKKSRFCLQVPNFSGFLIFSQLSQVFSGFLSFSQLFSGFLRFYTNHRLHRGTNMTRNSGLEKVPILLTSPKFLSFPRYTQLCILSMATLSDKLGQVSSEHRGFFEMPEISACPC